MNPYSNMIKSVSIALFTASSLFFFAGCKKTQEVKQPNILFCIADDATWMHMSSYGCDWINTPSFDRVAKNGVLFTNAYTPNAKCAPSRSSILTGRNSWQLEEAANHLCYFPAKFKSFAETLSENGYKVGYTGKGWAPGKMGEIDGKPRDLLVKVYNENRLTPPTTGISNIDYTENFKTFLNEREQGKPFFFWYGGLEPHRKYEYGTGEKLGNKHKSQIDEVPSFWPDVDSVRTDMLDYGYEIEYFDKHLGQILQLLEEKGELDNTLIVVTADNGMPFPRVKGHDYEYSNHLPLAMMWKDGINKPGRTINDFVSFIDFAATFADVANIDFEEKGMQAIQGKSLVPIFKSDKSGQVEEERDYVLLAKERNDIGRPHNQGYPIRAIRKGDFLYLKNFEPDRWPTGNPETGYMDTDGSPTKSYILNQRRRGESAYFWKLNFGKRPQEELYNLAEDRDCVNNLVEDEKYASVKEELRMKMEDELKKQGDPRMFGKGDIFDQYEPTSVVNFYERFMAGEKFRTGWINKSDLEKEIIKMDD